MAIQSGVVRLSGGPSPEIAKNAFASDGAKWLTPDPDEVESIGRSLKYGSEQ
jgi:hypothetical protein